MHLGDPAVGMLPAIAIVGGGNTVVTGLGLAFKLRRTDQVAVCFFGDGASNEGAFHEGMNFAAVRGLPDRLRLREQPLRRLHALQPSRPSSTSPTVPPRTGFPGHVVDGMDVLAVRDAGAAAVARARAGEGPTLLECKTYRFVGHSRSDARGYRESDEEASWKERDPIPRLRAVLVDTRGRPRRPHRAGGRGDDRRRGRVRARVARRRPEEALTDVYA